jgi:transposase
MESSVATPTITIPAVEYEQFNETVDLQSQRIEQLISQLRSMQHARFGKSSERTLVGDSLDIQMDLFGSAALAHKEPLETETTVKEHTRKKKCPVEERFPPNVPVETVKYGEELHPVCPECGEPMSIIGWDRYRPDELKIVPATVTKVEYKRAVWACKGEHDDERTPIVKAPAPQSVIKRGYLHGDAIANLAVTKFLLGQPLYRQEQQWSWLSVKLSRQTMCNSFIEACMRWLKPIYLEMKRLLTRQVLHADETTLRALHAAGKDKPIIGRYWQYRTGWDAPYAIIVYEFTLDRGREHPAAFLANWVVYVHTDGYATYHSLPNAIVVLGCWAHMHRYFYEAYVQIPESARAGSAAEKGLAYCNALFEVERGIERATVDERLVERLKSSKPIVGAFFA